MSQYPQTYRIDDWDKPWLPFPARLFNALPNHSIQKWVKLEEELLLNNARKATSLNNFGDEGFLIPFRLLLEDLNHYNHYTPLGRITARTILHQQLCARLCVEDRFNNDPGISEQKIRQPIIIAGLPRTGTTHLHNLLSQVNTLRYLPWWQTLNPVLPSKQLNNFDWRRLYNGLRLAAGNYFLPLLRRMHEMELDMPHEELTLSALCYRSFFFEGAFQVPNYRQWYAEEDHTVGYEYMKKILQILQTETAPGQKKTDAHWILKSPQHVDQLLTLVSVFPDAKIVLTHRDPCRAVLSMVTMMLYASRQVYYPTRRFEEAKAWVDRLEQMLRRSQQQAAQLPESNLIHIHFDEFMANQKETIKKVLDFAGAECDAVSEQAINELLQKHTRDRHGRIDYNFQDLGLDENEIRERFSFYQA